MNCRVMGRQNRKDSRARGGPAKPRRADSMGRWLAGGAGVGAVLLAVYLVTRPPAAQPSPASPPNPVSPTNTAASASPETRPQFRKLLGRWLRPDGGYVLDLRHVEDNGKLEAAYLNPRSIFVSRAEATQETNTTKVFVELQDVGYPGSNYTLTYDAPSDQLRGVYYQAAIQESFDIVFVRMK